MSTPVLQAAPVTLASGCAVSDSIAYVAAFLDDTDPEVAHTRLFSLNLDLPGRWFHHDLADATVVSVCLRPATGASARAVCALSDSGKVELANTAGIQIETITGAGLGEASRGLGSLSALRHIGDRLYACGAGNQIYRRDNSGWTAIDADITAPAIAALENVVETVKQTASEQPDMAALARAARVKVVVA